MITFAFYFLVASVLCDNWALLAAGSFGWANYRHQADVCAAYTLLIKNGFDPAKIVTLMYDDIADDWLNYFPGTVKNSPYGANVYPGSEHIDYRGIYVTPNNFVNALRGNLSGCTGPTPKVLQTTSEDNIFIFFNDHGSVGLLAFPDGQYLYPAPLHNAFNYLYNNSLYANILIYVESCYAGSMFAGFLQPTKRIYAMTAADSFQDSYAMYCYEVQYTTCMSNEFSQAWLVSSETADYATMTVNDQLLEARANTPNSTVSAYGGMEIGDYLLADFQHPGPICLEWKEQSLARIGRHGTSNLASERTPMAKKFSQVDAYEFHLRTAAEKKMYPDAVEKYHEGLALKEKEKTRTTIFSKYFQFSYPDKDYLPQVAKNEDLFVKTIETYESICGKLNEFSFWSHTLIFSRAINEEKLTEESFNEFIELLKRLA